MIRALRVSSLLLATSLLAGGCVVYDDDGYYYDDDEVIRYENYTHLTVDNYVDDVFIGTVPRSGGVLEIEGDYEGYHVFESFSEGDVLHWGPTECRLRDGDLLLFELVEGRKAKLSIVSADGARSSCVDL